MKTVIILRVLAGLSVALGIAFGLWNNGSLLEVIVGLIVGSSFYLSSEIRHGFNKMSTEMKDGFNKMSTEMKDGFNKVIKELRREHK